MPEWLITALSLAGSALISSIIGLLVRRTESKYDKEQKLNTELMNERLKRQEDEKFEQFHEKLLTELKQALEPIEHKISNLVDNFSEESAASLTILRSKMKTLRDQYLNQGFADIGDKATWNELYDHYKSLGGNHFKEYVDMWKTDVKNLPSEIKDKK